MKRKTLSSKTKSLLILAAGLVLLAILLATGDFRNGVDALTTSLLIDNDARVAYLSSLGWEVVPYPESRQEIVIPREFTSVYEAYNDLQKQQGFDLSDYKGLQCTLYVYTVTNWPDESLTVVADLYIYKNRVIGGDVHATALDGFMVGIR